MCSSRAYFRPGKLDTDQTAFMEGEGGMLTRKVIECKVYKNTRLITRLFSFVLKWVM